MKFTNTGLVAAILAASGFAVAGCSGGGGGGGGFSVAPPITTGSVTSDMPTVSRDPRGYTYSTHDVSTVRGSKVTALGVAPTGTQSFVAHFPLARVDIYDGALAPGGTLFFDAQSMAAVGTRSFAATGNALRAGAGDLFEFRNNRWDVVVNSADNEMVVGVVDSQLWAASGGINRRGELRKHDATTNAFSSVALLDSCVPTAIGERNRELWLGATSNAQTGGPARLFRLSNGTTLEEHAIPGAGQGTLNVRHEITAFASVAIVKSGSVAGVGSGGVATVGTAVLVFSIGGFDVASNDGVSGSIVATDGKAFEVLHSFTDDAPTALAFIDNTVFVGTAKGKLLYRDANGTFVDEPNVPSTLTGIESLLARDSATLLIGGKSVAGAFLVRRAGNSGSTVTPPVTPNYYYLNDVKAVLQAKCASCHMSPGLPTAVTVYGLSANMANDNADHTATRSKVDLANPANSLLIRKGTGGSNHLGGAAIAPGGPEAVLLTAWVQQGARLSATTTPPAQTPPKTYVADVKPILAARACASCHTAAQGRSFRLATPANDTADYAEAMQEVNTTTPESSAILRRPAQLAGHPLRVFPQGSADYNTILQWIQQGARFQ
jgi:hypothetical protein